MISWCKILGQVQGHDVLNRLVGLSQSILIYQQLMKWFKIYKSCKFAKIVGKQKQHGSTCITSPSIYFQISFHSNLSIVHRKRCYITWPFVGKISFLSINQKVNQLLLKPTTQSFTTVLYNFMSFQTYHYFSWNQCINFVTFFQLKTISPHKGPCTVSRLSTLSQLITARNPL